MPALDRSGTAYPAKMLGQENAVIGNLSKTLTPESPCDPSESKADHALLAIASRASRAQASAKETVKSVLKGEELKTYRILGIDPGLANTGLAIVRGDTDYKLVDYQHITTDKDMLLGARLGSIHAALAVFIERPGNDIDGITIEMAFANKNVSSNSSTQQVIGLVHLTAHVLGIPILEITPQELKKACGFGGRAKKNAILHAAKALFGRDFEGNSHLADAAFAAIAGILRFRSV